MADATRSSPPEPSSGRDQVVADSLDPSHYEECLCQPGYLTSADPEYRLFLERFVAQAYEDDLDRVDATLGLVSIWANQPDLLPWPTPLGVDVMKIANALIKERWAPPNWREGTVDTSEMHILVVNGGCLDEEPEGVDVALIGPDADEGVIVEFLPMEGVDPETAEGHRRYTKMLVGSRTEREPHPWRSVKRRCGSTANAYGPLRFNLRLGERPLVHLPHGQTRPTGLVAKQPHRAEGIGALGRFKVYNQREYVGIHLTRDELLIKGRIAWLSEDSVAVVLTWPILGGCVLRTVPAADESGHLVDDEGHLNGYGLRVVVELLNDMYESAITMNDRVPDIMKALRTAYESVSTENARIGPSVDARLRAIWKAVPEPAFDFDIAFFKSAIYAWGKQNPDYFDNRVWWVYG